jgi:hypothetical protein
MSQQLLQDVLNLFAILVPSACRAMFRIPRHLLKRAGRHASATVLPHAPGR